MSEELLKNTEAEENNQEQVVESVQNEAVAQEPMMETETVVEEPVAEVEANVVAEELPLVETPAPKKAKVIENAYPSLDDFNWDSIEKKGSKYSSQEKERYEDLYTKTFKSIDENEVINGSVVSINSREIVVNIGFKSDGVISANELRYNSDLKIGDTIEVYVENQEDSTGQLQLSHKKARLLQS
jgi:small subunit ribosomal protein S1